MTTARLERCLERRRVPCICPAQADAPDASGRAIPGTGACGRTTGHTTIRGRLHERVRCERCPRAWTRVND